MIGRPTGYGIEYIHDPHPDGNFFNGESPHAIRWVFERRSTIVDVGNLQLRLRQAEEQLVKVATHVDARVGDNGSDGDCLADSIIRKIIQRS